MKMHLVEDYLRFQETFDKIDCNSNEFLIFSDMRSKIVNYMLENGESIEPKDFLKYQYSLMTAIDTNVCPLYVAKYENEFEKLSEYIKESNKKFHKRNIKDE